MQTKISISRKRLSFVAVVCCFLSAHLSANVHGIANSRTMLKSSLATQVRTANVGRLKSVVESTLELTHIQVTSDVTAKSDFHIPPDGVQDVLHGSSDGLGRRRWRINQQFEMDASLEIVAVVLHAFGPDAAPDHHGTTWNDVELGHDERRQIVVLIEVRVEIKRKTGAWIELKFQQIVNIHISLKRKKKQTKK